MKKRKMDKIKLRAPITLLCCVIGLILFGCEEEISVDAAKYPSGAVYNPEQPVIVKDFTPKKGGIPTQILITGSNFGSDISMIKVMIDDIPLSIVSADGERIYAFLGKELSDDPEDKNRGVLKVTIGNEQNAQTEIADAKFDYIPQPYVITVAGWKEEDGTTSSRDGLLGGTGSFEYAQFAQTRANDPEKGDLSWLALDEEKNLYIVEEWVKNLRVIPHTWDRVRTLYNAPHRIRTIEFTQPAGDEMYMTMDNSGNNWNEAGTVIFQTSHFSRDKNDINPTTLINSYQCNGGALHPEDQTYFYNYFGDGIVYKYTGPKEGVFDGRQISENLFKMRDSGFEFTIQFHPSGDYAYLVIINKGYIMKSKYNRELQKLEQPTLFAGNFGQEGYMDGVGITAKFRSPWQGAFIGDDFYVCDKGNHCIRKITKDGVVSTYAGKPEDAGLDDGTLRDSRFDNPTGLVYDEDEKCFYVADRANARIRKIVLPKNQ